MKSNAPEQLLGYTLQLPRALVYLLQGGPGSSVCVEVVGDVTSLSETSTVLEEDKSSLRSNPVTNRSVALWKTFCNWIDALQANYIELQGTKFILYSTHAGLKGIVDCFSEADNPTKANDCLSRALEELKDIKEGHDIYPLLKKIEQHRDLMLQIIANFELIVGSKTGNEEVKLELKKMMIPDEQIDFIYDELLGWLTKSIMDKISNKEKAIIHWKEFKNNKSVIFQRARSKELIDFTTEKSGTDPEVIEHLKTYPYYIQQLKIIALDENGQLSAVSDYLRSKVNIQKWIEGEVIDENMANDFENKLERFWKNTRNRIAITNKECHPEERGKLVYSDCMNNKEQLADHSPPDSTIGGVYHSLADDDKLGWHESWKDILKNKEADSTDV